MRLVRLTRVVLGVQMLVGLALFAVWSFVGFAPGLVPEGSVRGAATAAVAALYAVVVTAHVVLALAIPVLALVALRPGRPRLPPAGPLRIVSWLAPLAPLALGVGFRLGLLGGLALVVLHMVLGFAAFGLVSAVQKRIDWN